MLPTSILARCPKSDSSRDFGLQMPMRDHCRRTCCCCDAHTSKCNVSSGNLLLLPGIGNEYMPTGTTQRSFAPGSATSMAGGAAQQSEYESLHAASALVDTAKLHLPQFHRMFPTSACPTLLCPALTCKLQHACDLLNFQHLRRLYCGKEFSAGRCASELACVQPSVHCCCSCCDLPLKLLSTSAPVLQTCGSWTKCNAL